MVVVLVFPVQPGADRTRRAPAQRPAEGVDLTRDNDADHEQILSAFGLVDEDMVVPGRRAQGCVGSPPRCATRSLLCTLNMDQRTIDELRDHYDNTDGAAHFTDGAAHFTDARTAEVLVSTSIRLPQTLVNQVWDRVFLSDAEPLTFDKAVARRMDAAPVQTMTGAAASPSRVGWIVHDWRPPVAVPTGLLCNSTRAARRAAPGHHHCWLARLDTADRTAVSPAK